MKALMLLLKVVTKVNSPTPIKLIVGLGNPGEQYMKTRHNAGFLFIDELCQQLGATLKTDKNCFGRSVKTAIAGQQVRLLEPDTFMNLSGKAVVAATQYYKIELAEILVVHDEIDLGTGVARLKLGGGHGGNNGLRDIIQKTASKEFARLRIGIGHPGVGRDVSGYVLKAANKRDQTKIENSIVKSLAVIDYIVAGDFPSAMNELHSETSA